MEGETLVLYGCPLNTVHSTAKHQIGRSAKDRPKQQIKQSQLTTVGGGGGGWLSIKIKRLKDQTKPSEALPAALTSQS